MDRSLRIESPARDALLVNDTPIGTVDTRTERRINVVLVGKLAQNSLSNSGLIRFANSGLAEFARSIGIPTDSIRFEEPADGT